MGAKPEKARKERLCLIVPQLLHATGCPESKQQDLSIATDSVSVILTLKPTISVKVDLCLFVTYNRTRYSKQFHFVSFLALTHKIRYQFEAQYRR